MGRNREKIIRRGGHFSSRMRTVRSVGLRIFDQKLSLEGDALRAAPKRHRLFDHSSLRDSPREPAAISARRRRTRLNGIRAFGVLGEDDSRRASSCAARKGEVGIVAVKNVTYFAGIARVISGNQVDEPLSGLLNAQVLSRGTLTHPMTLWRHQRQGLHLTSAYVA